MLEIEDAATPSAKQLSLAFSGMRNPLKSWDKSDSRLVIRPGFENFTLGKKDLDLAKRLIKAGGEHRKFLRQLPVTFEITAPEYFWRQMDQYKIGTTTNSESQMHTMVKNPFYEDDFSHDYLTDAEGTPHAEDAFFAVLDQLNNLREIYQKVDNETAKKILWHKILEHIPQSFYYLRTWSANYEVLFNICSQRAGHKLDEWGEFITFVLEQVPLFETLCLDSLMEKENFKQWYEKRN